MTLPTQPFRDFFAYTKAMKPNTILSVYSYILLTPDSLQKANGQVFCSMPFVSGVNEPVMIEEQEIKTFLSGCTQPEFTMAIEGNSITLSSGKLTVSFDTIPVTEFPSIPTYTTEPTAIDVSKLFIASKYTDPKQINWMQCVVADSNGIIGSDGAKLFHYNTPVNETVLTIESCNIICGMNDVKHTSSDTHSFFMNDDVFYAFNKSEYSNVRYMHVVEQIKTEGFTVKKSDLLLFCDTTTPRSDKACVLIGNGNTITLKLNDKDKNKKSELEIEIEGECTGEFYFYPANLAAAIRPLPYDKLVLNIDQHMSITSHEDVNYKGVLTKVIL